MYVNMNIDACTQYLYKYICMFICQTRICVIETTHTWDMADTRTWRQQKT